MNTEENIVLTKKQAYEAMIHILYRFYKETGSSDLTDFLTGAEYKETSDNPMDMQFKYNWDEIVEEVKKGKEPKRVNWK